MYTFQCNLSPEDCSASPVGLAMKRFGYLLGGTS
jgi:hypothetical protein